VQSQEAAASFSTDGSVDEAFVALNAAYFADGPAIILPADTALDRIIHVVHWAEAGAHHVKSVIRLGARAKAVVVETYAGADAGWTNLAETVTLGDDAHLGHYTLQNQAPAAFHTAYATVTLGEKSHYDGFLLSLGGRMARQDLRATLAGSHAFCGYSGAYLLQGRQESAVCTVIEHAAPNGQTKEVFKGCVADRAHGVFLGKIRVAEAGQKTDAYQLNKTLLLGDRAVMDAKPELEIYADDVKCSHGATVGDLDETALFYLRSRGIPPDIARHILIEAFVVDTVDLIEDETARAYFAQAVIRRLAS
jgi:Fe-S cluster assembly protein SufD